MRSARQATEILRDGDAIRVPMMVKDGATVDAIRGGTARELSVGYSTDIKWRQGVTDTENEPPRRCADSD